MRREHATSGSTNEYCCADCQSELNHWAVEVEGVDLCWKRTLDELSGGAAGATGGAQPWRKAYLSVCLAQPACRA